MVRSSSNESEDEGFSTDSYLSNDGHSIDGSSNMGVVLKKGPWTSAEDAILVDYVKQNGEGNWNAVQRHTGLSRCGKSCRLRWANHLRPNLKKGAFTSEEERLIIELHAKMGNKWARMAAQLPGRTDNEIKNYWNTRVKRHHRAGLPLYPPELYMQTNQENLQNLNSPGIYGGDKGYHDLLQISCYQTSDPIFDSLNDLPYRPESSSTSASVSMVNGFGPQFCTFVPQVRHDQELDESMSYYSSVVVNETPTFDQAQIDWYENKKFQSFALGLPYDPNRTKQVIPFAVNQDSHFMPNGNFSSSMPSQGAEKYELPSFQYQETDFGFWDPAPKSSDYLVEPPLYGKLPLRCPSPGSSGLLDDLLYEAMARSKSCNKLSDSTASSTINSGDITDGSAMRTCSTEFKSYSVLISPLGNSVESTSNERTPTDTIDSSLEKMISECQVKSEAVGESWTMCGERKDVLGHVDSSRPDAILGSCWLCQSAYCSKQRGPVTVPVTSILYDDMDSEFYMSAGTSASSWGLNSCTWNNMPAVFQMSELP